MDEEYFVSTVESDEGGPVDFISSGRRQGYFYETVTQGRQPRKRTISKKLLEADFDDPEIQALRAYKEAKTLAEKEKRAGSSETARKRERKRKEERVPYVDPSGLVMVVEGDEDEPDEEIVVTASEPAPPPLPPPPSHRHPHGPQRKVVRHAPEPEIEQDEEEEEEDNEDVEDVDTAVILPEPESQAEIVTMPGTDLPKNYSSVDGTFDMGSGIPIIGMEKLDLGDFPILATEDPDQLPTFLIGGGFKTHVPSEFQLPMSESEEEEEAVIERKQTKKKKPVAKKRHPFFDPDDYEWTPQLEQEDVFPRRGRTAADYWDEDEEAPIFHCDMCNFQSLIKKEFIRHLRTHDMFGPKYRCDKCDFQTHSKNGFKKHHQVHTNRELLQCDQCEFQTVSTASLRRHIALHNSDFRLRCTKCSFSTPFRQELRKHKELHEPKMMRRCDECDFVTYNKLDLKKHKRDEHEPIMFECEQCEFVTNIKNEFNSHLKQHCGIVSNYTCADCNYTTDAWTDYQKHLENHDDLRRHYCDECGMVFRQRVHLNRHKLYRHPEYNVPCDVCGFICAVRNPDIFIHMRQAHGDDALACELRKIGGDYAQCNVCGAETFTKRDAKQHQKFHRRGRPEVKLFCQQCSFVTDSESRLRRHELSHANERPFQCSQCDYRAAQKELIIRHIKTRHNPVQVELDRQKKLQQQRMQKIFEEELAQASRGPPEAKTFTCRHCQTRFQKIITLWKHVKLQHPEAGPTQSASLPNQEACPLCDSVLENKKLLLSHMRKHTLESGLLVSGADVFSCMLCPFSCSLRLTFYDHLRKKHKISVMLKQDGTTGYFQEASAADLPPLPPPPPGRLPPAAQAAQQKEKEQRAAEAAAAQEVVIIAGSEGPGEVQVMPSTTVHELEAGTEPGPEENLETASTRSGGLITQQQQAVQQMVQEQQQIMQQMAEQGGVVVEEEAIVQMEVGGVEGGVVPSQIQLTPEQLAALSSGDYIEIDGQMYKIEFATGDAGDGQVVGQEEEGVVLDPNQQQIVVDPTQETEVVETTEEEIVG